MNVGLDRGIRSHSIW